MNYALDQGAVAFAWQTLAWSNGRLDMRCHLYQYAINQTVAGISADRDRTIVSDDRYGQFVPQRPPTITDLSPSSGEEIGGTWVALTGVGLSTVTDVGFGPTSAVQMTVNSDSSIDAVSPPGYGTVDVTVMTPEATSAPAAFTYTPNNTPLQETSSSLSEDTKGGIGSTTRPNS